MLQQMKFAFREFCELVGNDPYLPITILGVVGATFVFAFVFNADFTLVFGVLIVGCVTAFLESRARRKKK